MHALHKQKLVAIKRRCVQILSKQAVAHTEKIRYGILKYGTRGARIWYPDWEIWYSDNWLAMIFVDFQISVILLQIW